MNADELIARLAVGQERVDPCAYDHVDHGPEAHLGRRLVHTMRGFLGADWDYDEAVAFIRSADEINDLAIMGHVGVRKDGKWVGFAVVEP